MDPRTLFRGQPDPGFRLEEKHKFCYRYRDIPLLRVACAFVFFAFFGFVDDALQNYRHLYSSVASLIGYLTSNLHGSSRA